MKIFRTRDLFSVLVLMLCASAAMGQEQQHVVIETIKITGNRKTKDDLILREIDFKVTDSLASNLLTDRLTRNERLLMNTGLFNEVVLNVVEWHERSIYLEIKVVESWYFFPIPLFSLADRNFNIWWTEFNASLSRVNYGLRLLYINLTGNKDDLKLHLQGGYSRRIVLQYDRPYINRRKTIGISGQYFLDHRREFIFNTIDNRQEFYNQEAQMNLKINRAFLSMQYRPRVENSHEVLLTFQRALVTDTILHINLQFFNGATQQRFLEASYTFRRERRDNRFYALDGYYIEAALQKVGLGVFGDIDKLNTDFVYSKYVPLGRFNFETRNAGRVEWTGNEHPYYGLNALGYGDYFIRGYEFYLIDATDFILSRNAMRFQLLRRSFDLGRAVPLRNYRHLPIGMWLSLNFDFGYAANDRFRHLNPLNNRLLVGRGIGLDILLYYKFAFQLEYSINHLGEKGAFLNVRSGL